MIWCYTYYKYSFNLIVKPHVLGLATIKWRHRIFNLQPYICQVLFQYDISVLYIRFLEICDARLHSSGLDALLFRSIWYV